MALLETVVLLDVVQVITTDDDGAVHAGGDNNSLEDGTTNSNIPSKGAFVINVVPINGRTGSLEAKTDIFVISGLLLDLKDERRTEKKNERGGGRESEPSFQ